MKTITCDLCEKIITFPISVSVRDGEHPHSGNIMYKQIDCCEYCTRQIPDLRSFEEFDKLCRLVK